jgi:predicted nucleotidyltransferase component of viral defense system
LAGVGVPALTLDENLWVASLEDLLATKLKVLMQRVEVKDYFDRNNSGDRNQINRSHAE